MSIAVIASVLFTGCKQNTTQSQQVNDKVVTATTANAPGVKHLEGEWFTVDNNAPEGYVDIGNANIRPDGLNHDGCNFSVNDAVASKATHLVKPVYCTLTHDMVQASKGKRDQFKADPAFWPEHNVKVHNNKGKDIYVWNRSHLIADQLGGEATPRNSITGTRFQNVGNGDGGMRKPEAETAKFIESHPNCKVQYDATPVYISATHGLPAAVIVDVHSCDGKLNHRYSVPNVQPGYKVNIQTAEIKPLEDK